MTLSECCTPAHHPARVARTPAKLCGGRVPRRLGMRSDVLVFCAFSPQPELLDAPEHVDPCEASAGLCVLSKKATRSLLRRCMGCCARGAYFSARAGGPRCSGGGICEAGQASEAPTSRVGVALQKFGACGRSVAELLPRMLHGRRSQRAGAGEYRRAPSQRCGRARRGGRCGCRTLEMHTESTQVHASALPALVSAVRFYYITPSATLYRALVLQEKVLPGQRLNYAFDYQHFDTGQLSQVHLCFCYALIVVILTCMLSWYFYARFCR